MCVQDASARHTRRRLERTHGGVLNLHTERFSAFSVFLALSLSFLLSLSLLLFLCSLLSCLLSLLSLSSPSLLSSLSATMTMISRPVGSLCVHTALTCDPVGRTCSHHARNKHVRIMQETTVMVLLCKPRATWDEVGLYLCWKWVMCQYVLVCVVLLVASVLASVRWLLCGGDGSKKWKKNRRL